jgi:hypothetical protein
MLIRNQDVAPDLLELIGAAEQPSVDHSALSTFSYVASGDPFDGLSEPSMCCSRSPRLVRGGLTFSEPVGSNWGALRREITLEDIRISRSEIAPGAE